MSHTLPEQFGMPEHYPSGRPDLLISALLHLMSHYSRSAQSSEGQGCPAGLAAVIERHLSELAALPGLTPLMRATCQQLAGHWSELIEHNKNQPRQTPKSIWRQRFSF